MSSQEFEQLNASLAAVGSRVDRLEALVGALLPAPPPRTYTVQPGDTLSGIATQLGLPDWQRLYEANAAVIGPDPNRILPGQVLVVP
jgi:nucleoid-associated protein YgaU